MSTHIHGHDIDQTDVERLETQMGHVLQILQVTPLWLTVSEIRLAIRDAFGENAPEPSISAQLRNLRKEANGGHNVQGRYRKGMRIYEYKLIQQDILL